MARWTLSTRDLVRMCVRLHCVRLAEMELREIVSLLDLSPLPLEGGMFRETWAGPSIGDRASGTAIIVALSAPDDLFSAMHRLPLDETWHFYLGDPVEMLLLYTDETWRVERSGAGYSSRRASPAHRARRYVDGGRSRRGRKLGSGRLYYGSRFCL